MENTVISEMLMWILVGMLGLLFLLIIVYIILKLRTSTKKEEKTEEDIKLMQDKPKNKEKKKKSTEAITYSKQSIFDFMEFDEVQDNMIIQKNNATHGHQTNQKPQKLPFYNIVRIIRIHAHRSAF